jgi:hypothetical protein
MMKTDLFREGLVIRGLYCPMNLRSSDGITKGLSQYKMHIFRGDIGN